MTEEATQTATSDANVVAEAVNASTTGEQVNQTNDADVVAEAVGEPTSDLSFVLDKFKKEGRSEHQSLVEQAKSYGELQKQFGSFTGAPEEYSVNLSEDLTNEGVEINSDDPLMVEAIKFAKERNMNQEGFDSMVELYAMGKLADAQALEESKVDEMKALGNDAQSRVNNLNAWANANLSTEMMDGFQALATDAKAVQTLERLVAMTRNAPIAPAETAKAPGRTASELLEMKFKKDDNGNLKIRTDPAFGAEFREAWDNHYGTEPHKTVIGR